MKIMAKDPVLAKTCQNSPMEELVQVDESWIQMIRFYQWFGIHELSRQLVIPIIEMKAMCDLISILNREAL